jgi:hypothetical protein
MSPFHQELFSFLKGSAERRAEEEGFDPEHDPELQKFHRTIEQPETATLDEIIEDYHHIFTARGPIHIEYRWMNSFSEKEFSDEGLSRFFPRIYRGLPRLYRKDNPSVSRIKKNFTSLASLKSLSVDRALFSLYEGKWVPEASRIGILTHVLPDGLGDWIAATETASILAAKWPSLDIHLFAVSSRELEPQEYPFEVHVFSKETPPPILNQMDFLLQIPTLFPEEIILTAPVEKMGEYGFMESDWYHPKSGNRSLGLHVLEKGIFVRKMGRCSFAEIEQKALLLSLFNTETPGPVEIEAYRQTHRFHLAYLATSTGGAIYFNSLLKMWEKDKRDIDLCCPDLRWFIEEGRQLLVQSFGVREIVVLFKEKIYRIPVSKEGKTVRILVPESLSQADMRRLLSLSDDWVAVRGNQSLSEAISAGKAFFYDGRDHARYFVKDLAALAENRLSGHPRAVIAFRQMYQAFLWNLPEDLAEWVDESYFQRQEKPPWPDIAIELGAALQDPDAIVGFKKFCRIVSEEQAFNPFLCHLVERELFHAAHPAVRGAEQQLLQLYAAGQIPFSALVKNLKVSIVRK